MLNAELSPMRSQVEHTDQKVREMDGEGMLERKSGERVSGVGTLLRSCRSQSGLTLADVSRSLRIRQAFLAAIEDGRFGDLPGPAYALGFLRAYADFLGLDGNEVVRRFRAESAEANEARELHFPKPDSESSVPKTGILLVGLLIAAVGYGGWYLLSSQSNSLSDIVGPLPERLSGLIPGGAEDPDGTEITVVENGSPAEGAPAASGTIQAPAPASPPATAGPVARPTTSDQAAIATADREVQPDSEAAIAGDSGATTAAADSGSPAPAPAATAAGTGSAAPAVPPASLPPGSGSEDAPGPMAALEPAQPATPEPPVEPAEAAGVPEVAPADQDSVPGLANNGGAGAGAGAVTGDGDGMVLSATEASWIEIRDEFGNRVFSRILKPGETYDVPEQDGLVMTVGNAGGLVVMIDGQVLPALGGSGVVLRRLPLEADALRAAAGRIQ